MHDTTAWTPPLRVHYTPHQCDRWLPEIVLRKQHTFTTVTWTHWHIICVLKLVLGNYFPLTACSTSKSQQNYLQYIPMFIVNNWCVLVVSPPVPDVKSRKLIMIVGIEFRIGTWQYILLKLEEGNTTWVESECWCHPTKPLVYILCAHYKQFESFHSWIYVFFLICNK